VIGIPSTIRVFLGTQPQDFRKSIDGLAGVVQAHLDRDPLTGDVFVFHNRRRTALKLLYWDHGGFCLVYTRRIHRAHRPSVSAHAGHAVVIRRPIEDVETQHPLPRAGAAAS
jgi:transposase